MKRFIVLATALFTLGFAQEVYAQKWLKKLGKVANAILNGSESSTSSNTSEKTTTSNASSFSHSKSSQTATAPIQVSVTDACRYGSNSVRVGFVMKNLSQTDLMPYVKASTAQFAGMSNKVQSSYISVVTDDYWSLVDYLSTTDIPTCLPAGGLLKGYMIFSELPKNVNKLEQLNLNFINPTSKDGGVTFEDKIFNPQVTSALGVTIKPFDKADANGSLCTYPDFSLKVNSLHRSGTKVTLSFTLTNNGPITYFSFGEWLAYDEDGNTYKQQGLSLDMSTQGINTMYSSQLFKFMTNASRTFTLTINKVPTSVNTFSLIRIPIGKKEMKQFNYDGNIYTELSIRNAKLTSASR